MLNWRYIGVFATIAACAPAFAQPLLWFPAQRTIDAETDFRAGIDPPPVRQFASGPDAGAWNAALFVPNQFSFHAMDLFVGQASTPTIDGLVCQQFAVFEFFAPDVLDVSVFAESHMQSYFAVTSQVDATLIAQLSASVDTQHANIFPADYRAVVQIELRRVGDHDVLVHEVLAQLAFWDEQQVQVFLSDPIAWTGNLPLGIYEISISTIVMSDDNLELIWAIEPGRCEAAISMSLTVAETPPPGPCEGDLDGDGDADILDFSIFQQCFSGPQP